MQTTGAQEKKAPGTFQGDYYVREGPEHTALLTSHFHRQIGDERER
jgi:hypothetical protein